MPTKQATHKSKSKHTRTNGHGHAGAHEKNGHGVATPNAAAKAREQGAAPKKVVLAYSGGLDTSVIVAWLIETYGCEVIAMIGDLGQEEDLEAARRKALATGASAAYVEDLREEFITDFIWPTLRAGAVYEHKYLLGTSFARPLLAKRQVELARKVGADAVAHGCTGKGNDQVRFELAAKALAPELRIIAPWREWDIVSREDAIVYAQAHKIPVEQSKTNIYSRDRNIWHLSHEGGRLEDPANAPEEAMWQWIVAPSAAHDKPTRVEIGFEAGIPVSVDGKKLGAIELVEKLNEIAAANGVGRMDIVENRLVGIKSRGAYETPGGTLLVTAHRELETLSLDRETAHYQQIVSLRYAEMVYYGMWFTPLREALDAFFASAQSRVTGTVGLELYKGNINVITRKSPNSLYRTNLASFTMTGYNPKDAEGFINLFALPITVPQGDSRR
ncbi:MAG TPA: argininosuccinate synthase [Candidatus Acidoferrales bacterium]